MAQELRWPGAHPMQLDISLDQLAFLRATRRLSGHTVPGVAGREPFSEPGMREAAE